jgi:hypothetical protein
MIKLALAIFFLIQSPHSHDLSLLSTWETMRTLPGVVVCYESGVVTVRHQDKYKVVVVDYTVDKNLTIFPRNPKKDDKIVVLFCPEDKILYTFVVDHK